MKVFIWGGACLEVLRTPRPVWVWLDRAASDPLHVSCFFFFLTNTHVFRQVLFHFPPPWRPQLQPECGHVPRDSDYGLYQLYILLYLSWDRTDGRPLILYVNWLESIYFNREFAFLRKRSKIGKCSKYFNGKKPFQQMA